MKRHCEKYDAYFEVKTGKWLEKGCRGKDCEFCSRRPKRHQPHRWVFIDGKEGICK